MARSKINIDDLRNIIKEEISTLSEQVDHKGISGVVSAASKLLAAVESFRDAAPPSATSAVTPAIDQLQKVLEDMVSTPGSYVAKPKPVVRKVSLKPVKDKE